MSRRLTRPEARDHINFLYARINDVARSLKSRERELDHNRAAILRELEEMLEIANNSEDYRDGINRLNIAGLREYIDMLTELLNRMMSGIGRRIDQQPIDRSLLTSIPQPAQPYFTVARTNNREPLTRAAETVHPAVPEVADFQVPGWINNGDGTFTAMRGATLYGLAGPHWREFTDFSRDPRTLQVGEIVRLRGVNMPAREASRGQAQAGVITLIGNNELFLQTQQNLEGGNYVWGGRNPATHGGVDCSGAILFGLETLGNNNLPRYTAQCIFDNLTDPVVGGLQPGDLRFLFDANGNVIHVQTIAGVDGSRINATGGPENTRDNPGIIELLPGPIPASGEIRRLRWE